MTLRKDHRTPRTFNCLNGLLHQIRDDFVSLNTQSESKIKPNGWKTQSDFVKRKIVPETYMYKYKFVCNCVKLRMF